MPRKHRNPWCDPPVRTDHAAGGQLDAERRALFTELPDRFMVGTDTFTPQRWPRVLQHARRSRCGCWRFRRRQGKSVKNLRLVTPR